MSLSLVANIALSGISVAQAGLRTVSNNITNVNTEGYDRKEQVQEMVKRLLKLPGLPGTDAADALACAICHAHGGFGLGALATSGLRIRKGRVL